MDFSTLKKMEGSHLFHSFNDNDMVEMIVTVKQASYHPQNVEVRVQISDTIFTGQTQYKNLKLLEQDLLVESFSISKALGSY